MTNWYASNNLSVIPKDAAAGIDWDLSLPTPAGEQGFRTLAQVMESLENRRGEGLRMEFHYAPGLSLEVWKRDEDYITKIKVDGEESRCRYLLEEDLGVLSEKMHETVCGADAVGTSDEPEEEKGFCWTVSVPVSLAEERFEPVETVIRSLRDVRCEYLIMDLQCPVDEVTFIQTTVDGGRYQVEIHFDGKYRMKQYRCYFDTADEVIDIFRALACKAEIPDLRGWKDVGWQVLQLAGWRLFGGKNKVS